MIDGSYTLMIDNREGHAKAEVWRAGRRLPDGEALSLIECADILIAVAIRDAAFGRSAA